MNPRERLSDADRDRAASDLAEHYAQGRLDAEEHAERLDAIWTARTNADLEPIFEDLPRRTPERPSRGGRRGWQPVPFLPIVALLIVISIVTHLPFWILIFFVGCGLFARRRKHAWH
jgi:hypothetical protein